MSDAPEKKEISGHLIELEGDRSVWAGEYDNSWFIRFKSADGDLRHLRLSHEAADALVSLLTAETQAIYRYVLQIAATLP